MKIHQSIRHLAVIKLDFIFYYEDFFYEMLGHIYFLFAPLSLSLSLYGYQ